MPNTAGRTWIDPNVDVEELADAEGRIYLDDDGPELYQGYGEDHAEFLGEDPFTDRIEP